MSVTHKLITALLFVAIGATAHAQDGVILSAPRSGTFSFADWAFSWNVGIHGEGLELYSVKWKGVKVLHEASLPVIRVKYRGAGGSLDAGCGPYADRIEWDNMEVLSDASSKVTLRFMGDTLELAAYAEIGGYDLYHAWLFHRDGRLQPFLYSRGWSCGIPWSKNQKDHKHHPYWRLDFDVVGYANEAWEVRRDPSSRIFVTKYRTETDAAKTSDDQSIAWVIVHPDTGKQVEVAYPGNEPIDAPGRVWFAFSNQDFGVRLYHRAENFGWPFGAFSQLPFATPPESVDRDDVVAWVVGHLTHTWSEADADHPGWHWTGPVIRTRW